MLRKVFGSKSGLVYITRSFTLCNPHQIIFVSSNQEGYVGQGMRYVREAGEVLTRET
jgi:hypothetical protein